MQSRTKPTIIAVAVAAASTFLAFAAIAGDTHPIEGQRGDVTIVMHIQDAYMHANRAYKMCKHPAARQHLGIALLELDRAKLAEEKAGR